MKKFALWNLVYLFLLYTGDLYAQTDVLTQHNDLGRTGWNNQETSLNTTNVNSNTFGLLYNRTVDDNICAQPLVVSGVNIPNVGLKNIVYVVTLNNTVYAFDADDQTAGAYWQINFTNTPLSGSRPANVTDMHPSLCFGGYQDFPSSPTGNLGITGTPVIDKAANTIYFVTKIANGTVDNHSYNSGNNLEEYTYTSTGFHQYLHAVDLSTGAEKTNSPVEITATYSGSGDNGLSDPVGTISFDPRRQFARPGLLLLNGIVYISYAAHCDFDPAHGWIIGYNSTTLARQIIYNTTPNDGRGGIWMSGTAPAVDPSGNIYFTTGNSLNDDASNPNNNVHNNYTDAPSSTNRGEGVTELTPNTNDNTATSLTVSSYFSPYNYAYLNDNDLDFPIQVLLPPNTTMAITGAKDGNLYVMTRGSLGMYNSSFNNVLQQVTVPGSSVTMHASFAYFGGATTQYLYQYSENSPLLAYPVLSNSLGTPITGNSNIPGPNGGSGAYMSVSSNGTDPTTAILWVYHYQQGCGGNNCPGVLRALKAADVTAELWNSTMTSGDGITKASKMSCPTIANGKVYLSTFNNQLKVYGLKTNTTCLTNVAFNKTATASSNDGTDLPNYAFDGNMTTRWASNTTDNEWIYVDLGARYDICEIAIYWEAALGKDFNLQVSDDASTWTTVDAVTGNSSQYTEFDGSASGRYVRMQGIHRGTTFGYSIWEMQVYGNPASPCATPTSLTASSITQNTATLGWNSVFGETQYIIQYKPQQIDSWITRTSSTNSLPISALSCNTTYNYTVEAICGANQSTVAGGSFGTSVCTAPCGALITRYNNADIGDIGIPGSSCLSNGIYTISGSGADIGGNQDEFQYMWTRNVPTDPTVSAQILTQDALSPTNKAGVMMRDSLTNTSRFAFIAAENGGNNIVFEYRSAPSGATTSMNITPPSSLPYWVSLQRSGTLVTAFTSTDGTTWTQVAGPVDVGFGISTSPVPPVGLAVTSANNSVLSTATIGNFSISSGSPLPFKLLSFTATNVNNDYVSLLWSTSMEQNVDHFEIERSTDRNSFTTVASVKAVGQSDIPQYYSAKDEQPSQGINFYRLKEVDLDGKFYYSSVVPVQFGKENAPLMYPNPSSALVTIVAGSEPVSEIMIYDALGKQLKRIDNTGGSTSITVNIGGFGNGIYIVQIKTPFQVYQQKLFKQ